jgi:hypothetical protein
VRAGRGELCGLGSVLGLVVDDMSAAACLAHVKSEDTDNLLVKQSAYDDWCKENVKPPFCWQGRAT